MEFKENVLYKYLVSQHLQKFIFKPFFNIMEECHKDYSNNNNNNNNKNKQILLVTP